MKASSNTPKKDVIYVDIEDDITSIIDKVKHAHAPIVALVPPKRIGALQSVVNLKLLQRAAESSKKRIVMITSDHALIALAGGVSIPIARNLQSKPELPEVTALKVDDDEIIDGEALPAVATGEAKASEEAVAPAVSPAPPEVVRRADSASKIPNFDAFRTRAALIGAALLVLVIFSVWALVFAPRAVVTIAAITTPYAVNKELMAGPGSSLDAEAGTLSGVVKEIAKTASADFQATGKKDVGEKATGTVKFSQQAMGSTSVPAGTELETSGGLVFVTTATVTVPASTVGPGCFPTACPGTATGSVTAAGSGTKYNAASGSLSGAPSGVSASFTGPSGGGTDKTITVVSEQDAAAAREKITAQDANTVKAELKKQFASDSIVVNESFNSTPGNPSVSPAVGEEATGGKVTVETKYTMLGVKKTDVGAILENDLKKQLAGIPNQTIYNKGVDAVRFSSVTREGDAYKLTLQATGYVGPSIDTAKLAAQLSGKREGEIIAQVKTYDGIDDVKVAFSPFWVSTAPSPDKITIKFQINNANR